MIVIKINEVPNSKEGLKERTRRAWRINQDRLYNQKTLIAVYKGEILEEYKVLQYGPDKIEPNRVAFDLEEIPNSILKGQKITYRTSNPCTIVDPLDLGLLQPSNNVQVAKQYKFVDPKVKEKQLSEALEKGENAMNKLETLKTVAFDIKNSVFDNSTEALMYVTKDIYAERFIVAIPVITFSWDISMEESEKDYEWLLKVNVGDMDMKERLVKAIKKAILEFE